MKKRFLNYILELFQKNNTHIHVFMGKEISQK